MVVVKYIGWWFAASLILIGWFEFSPVGTSVFSSTVPSSVITAPLFFCGWISYKKERL